MLSMKTAQDGSDDDGSAMEMDMDETRPIGGILSNHTAKPSLRQSRKSAMTDRYVSR